jgi:hypothetical protein
MNRIINIVFLMFSISIWSQGNLQFNQVKLVSSQETVPAGKVWKIENILPSVRPTTTSWGNATVDFIININNQAVYYLSSESKGNLGGNGTTGIAAITAGIGNSPLWIPAGTTLSAGTNVLSISVIEFNIIP